MKKFIITVDTEGDNLWNWKPGNAITTYNGRYIDRFQNLCEGYDFIPVYLCNYEMINDDYFCSYISKKASDGKCEIGMHLHAWNSPPLFDLQNNYGGQAYITEFSREQILEKHIFLRDLIIERTGTVPTSYRSGRWATNDVLFSVLDEIGITVDCSVTPGVSLEHCAGQSVQSGNSYIGYPSKPYRLTENLIEVPLTTKLIRSYKGTTVKNKIRNLIKGKQFWLRPAVQSLDEMIYLISQMERENVQYLEYMIHSSELMAGGSPYGRDQEGVEQIYTKTERLFEYVNQNYKGISLRKYHTELVGDM